MRNCPERGSKGIPSFYRRLKRLGSGSFTQRSPRSHGQQLPCVHEKAPGPLPENWHESFIEHLAYVTKPKLYVELGLYHCELFNRVIPHAESLIGVDLNAEAGKWVSKSDKVKFINSTTDEFAAMLRAHPVVIDLLFIDADHSRRAVLNDFWSFFPFISPHGIIILHDTHPKNVDYTDPSYCADAYTAAEELSRHKDEFEMMTIPIHPGLTLCRKRTKQLSWMESPANKNSD